MRHHVDEGIARKLMEIGFTEPCLGVFEILINGGKHGTFRLNYNSEGMWQNHNREKPQFERNDWYWSAPLYQQVFEWFRTNNIFGQIELDQTTYPKFAYSIYNYSEEEGSVNSLYPDAYSDLFITYREAEDECIEKMIEVFKRIKNG